MSGNMESDSFTNIKRERDEPKGFFARSDTVTSCSSNLVLKNGSVVRQISDPSKQSETDSAEISVNDVLEIYMNTPYSGTQVTGYQSPISSSEFVSPVPNLRFSPRTSIENHCLIQREKILEELVQSESNYITSLQLLLNFYLTPLSSAKSSSILFTIAESCIGVLQDNHSKLLRFFQSVAKDVTLENNSLLVAAAFASGICQFGIDTNIYEEFISKYADITKLIKSKYAKQSTASYVAYQNQIISGAEAYLQSTQPSSMHMDLSFFSLMQRPVSRISKYRLIIESLLNSIFEVDQNYACIQNCLGVIKTKLGAINESVSKLKQLDVCENMNRLICKLDRPIEYFGKAGISGAMLCAWVESGEIKYAWCSIICFKAYILINKLDLNELQPTCTNSFVILLSSCSLSTDYKNATDFGGLVSEYPFTLKLQFENNYCKYEILLVSMLEQEFLMWKEHLESYISLQGENSMDYSYSQSCTRNVFKCPSNLNPYDIHILKYSSKNLRLCYFSEVLSVGITSMDNKPLQPDNNRVTLELRLNDRLKVEGLLSSIWTRGYPLLGLERYQPKKNDLRKNLTWRWKGRIL